MWLATILLAGAAILASPATPGVVVLDEGLLPLVEHFNARSDRLRFVAILSPT